MLLYAKPAKLTSNSPFPVKHASLAFTTVHFTPTPTKTFVPPASMATSCQRKTISAIGLSISALCSITSTTHAKNVSMDTSCQITYVCPDLVSAGSTLTHQAYAKRETLQTVLNTFHHLENAKSANPVSLWWKTSVFHNRHAQSQLINHFGSWNMTNACKWLPVACT